MEVLSGSKQPEKRVGMKNKAKMALFWHFFFILKEQTPKRHRSGLKKKRKKKRLRFYPL